MRKFIYLFMFLFACTSYAQTEQISGQFRLIGTQEQPEADKVLTIDDNGDVGYMNSNRPSFARYRWTNHEKHSGLVGFPIVVFQENEKTARVSSNSRIGIVEAGYFDINAVLIFEGISPSSINLLKNGVETISFNASGNHSSGVSLSAGIIYLETSDYLQVNVDTASGSTNLKVDLSIQKIK